MRHLFLKMLLLITGVALSIFLLIYFDIHTIVLAWFVSVREASVILMRTFFVRRMLRPLWMVLIRSATAVLGGVMMGKIRRSLFRPVDVVQTTIIAYWRWLPRPARIAFIMLCICAAGFLGAGLYLVPLLIPFLGPIIRGLKFWGFDQIFDRWLKPVRLWSKRTYRRTPLLRAICGPYRRSEAATVRWLRKKKHEHSKRTH